MPDQIARKSKFSIEIYDTREGVELIVLGVPADTELEACQKVAEKKGYIWIGRSAQGGDGPCYAIDEAYFGMWNDKLEPDEYQNKLAAAIDMVRQGQSYEFRGLLELFEHDTLFVEYGEL